ncbi:hypothetical protein DP939_19270 [Spongiactinospora rosea]|uniref:Uncharacterized protein n=1 Tax=Spongiactinospora rosea TaxID=2248750 RepID=A0A366LXD9_9ACTN|nr:hypothetical protein DP939_19270 [Spongiactinospora rosea]
MRSAGGAMDGVIGASHGAGLAVEPSGMGSAWLRSWERADRMSGAVLVSGWGSWGSSETYGPGIWCRWRAAG